MGRWPVASHPRRDALLPVCQAFFPRTSAWDNLERALRAEYDESLWEHLSGTTAAPFELGELRQNAVKVIDERGNELLVVWSPLA